MGRKPTAQGPKFVSYFWPVIEALKKLGGSARPAEVREEIAAKLGISDAAQAETLQSGFPRFDNQVAWARFYLVKAGTIDSSSRGVWTLTEKGRALTGLSGQQALELFKKVHAQFHVDRGAEKTPEAEEAETAPPQDAASPSVVNYRQQLLEILRTLPPRGLSAFASGCSENPAFRKCRSPAGPGTEVLMGSAFCRSAPS
ncbi:MAG: winged helix-turn-helix domain-containing protein [Acidobacteria bacterium]|nr:winged helix-turn-helix domain-containing protein [Acidobacteriota bacterium]